MAIPVTNLPNYADLLAMGNNGGFSQAVQNLGANSVLTATWNEFIDKQFPELKEAAAFIDDKYMDTEKMFLSKNFGMDIYVGSIFKESLREFFSVWLPKSNLPNTTVSQMQSAFRQFMSDASRDPSTFKTPTIFYWAWFLLLKQLKQTQETSLNKAKGALVFAYGEQAAVTQMSKIQFKQQTSDSDYATIKHNMDAQQAAESQRNWRSIVGKSTSLYQNDVQVANENRTQISQMTTKMLQEIESLATSITRIG